MLTRFSSKGYGWTVRLYDDERTTFMVSKLAVITRRNNSPFRQLHGALSLVSRPMFVHPAFCRFGTSLDHPIA